ncbi:DUF393 domain-containing protein [Ilumatobacteraceae bacterium]|nr:DUF393 domain-containing protein [Ilumatobacteraceae bacterium]
MTGSDALPILIFDGDCGFCTRCAVLARRWLKIERVEPWQRLDLAPLGLDQRRCEAALQWVGTDGLVAEADRAVVAALRYRGGLWKVPATMLSAPGIRVISAASYRWVARHRHSLPGGDAACRIDPDDINQT